MSLLEALEGCQVIDLEHPRQFGDPTFPAHRPGTLLTLHRRHEVGLGEPRTSASGMLVTAEHSGTHIDAICHQAYGMQLFGHVEVDSHVQTATGFTKLGIDTVAPILAPAVLVDVARVRRVSGIDNEIISLAEVQQAASHVQAFLRPGDVILVRTGFGAYWGQPEQYLRAPGVSTEASVWLANLSPRAVGIDNVAWDLPGYRDPGLDCTLPGHVVLLVERGIHIIENLNLEELAQLSVKRFLFVCLPLKVRGGTGSPVRPIAVLDGQS